MNMSLLSWVVYRYGFRSVIYKFFVRFASYFQLLNINYKNVYFVKIKFQLTQNLKFTILVIIFHGVMVYVVEFGAFLGVGVVLCNFLVYLKANYRRAIPFKIKFKLPLKFKT
jgi:hypothetical protein